MDDVFKELIWSAIKKAALAALFKAVPWLAWGPLGVAVGFVVGLAADYLYDAIKMTIDLKMIVFKNDQLRRAYDDASAKLAIIAHGKGIDSPEFKSAREEHKKKLSEFVKFA